MSSRRLRSLMITVVLAALLVPSPAVPQKSKAQDLTPVSGKSPFSEGCSPIPFAENPEDAEVEVSLAVNPANPQNMIAAWMQDNTAGIVTAATHDGGQDWTGPTIVPGVSVCSRGDFLVNADPWLSIGPDGTAYLASFSLGAERSRVQVSTSTDGGETWSNPVLPFGGKVFGGALTAHDKPAVTADPTEPCVAYVVWKEKAHGIGGPEIAVMFSRTDDCGQTWSVPIPAIRGGLVEGHLFKQQEVLVLLNKTLLTVTSIVTGADTPGEIVVSRSQDGGALGTWSDPPDPVAQFTWSKNSVDSATGEEIHTQQEYAFADVAPDGRVHIAYHHRTDAGDHQIRVISSTDATAKEWDEPVVVSEGPAQKYLPSLAVAGDGTVGITYYDLRNDTEADDPLEEPEEGEQETEPLLTDVFLAFSKDGGRQWNEQHVAGPFDLRKSLLQRAPENGYTVGDYHGIDGLPHGFGAAFALAKPFAIHGATDVFFTEMVPQVPTTLDYVGDERGLGETVRLAARLTTEEGAPVAGRTVAFALAEQVLVATTDGTGLAETTAWVPDHGHALEVQVTFAGDDVYGPSEDLATVTWGAGPPPHAP